MSLSVRLENLAKTIRTTRNWPTVLTSALLNRPFVAAFRMGTSLRIESGESQAYFVVRDLIFESLRERAPRIRLSQHAGNRVIEIGRCKFILTKEFGQLGASSIMQFLELFQENLLGYEVIDAGAYVGDTAIFFASRGARVYAYEPIPELFSMMVKNIALNGMEASISPMNCAVGESRFTRIYVNRAEGYLGSSMFIKPTESWVDVRSVNLEEAFANCHRGTRKILKLDCEGCEFAIITMRNLALLKQFDQVVGEYHSDLTSINVQALTGPLESAGFQVSLRGNAMRGLLVANK